MTLPTSEKFPRFECVLIFLYIIGYDNISWNPYDHPIPKSGES